MTQLLFTILGAGLKTGHSGRNVSSCAYMFLKLYFSPASPNTYGKRNSHSSIFSKTAHHQDPYFKISNSFSHKYLKLYWTQFSAKFISVCTEFFSKLSTVSPTIRNRLSSFLIIFIGCLLTSVDYNYFNAIKCTTCLYLLNYSKVTWTLHVAMHLLCATSDYNQSFAICLRQLWVRPIAVAVRSTA
jgi:hypothetical protein